VDAATDGFKWQVECDRFTDERAGRGAGAVRVPNERIAPQAVVVGKRGCKGPVGEGLSLYVTIFFLLGRGQGSRPYTQFAAAASLFFFPTRGSHHATSASPPLPKSLPFCYAARRSRPLPPLPSLSRRASCRAQIGGRDFLLLRSTPSIEHQNTIRTTSSDGCFSQRRWTPSSIPTRLWSTTPGRR
jgi:hypothetical protein